ncbi:RES family NAD+ phosphorylase [Flavobacterium sp. MDT1-60]|nr:RES family NAD+ phosphorylase [Flavobacterium sp. MDT1-60]
MFGEIEPLKTLHDELQINNVIKRILELYPKHILNAEHPFYRIRINPKIPHEFPEYDSPPEGIGGGNRLNWNGEAVLYASPDLELCIHECRASVEDDLYVAKLIPTQPLKMLNLAALIIEEDVDEFNSLDLAIHFLFLAGKHSYSICSKIAQSIKKEGFDGIIYPSYFSNIRTGNVPFETIHGMSIRHISNLKDYAESQSVPNIVLFGWPIKENKVKVHSINKITINSIKYDLTFGPAYNEALLDKSQKEKFIEKKIEDQLEKLLTAFNENSDEHDLDKLQNEK